MGGFFCWMMLVACPLTFAESDDSDDGRFESAVLVLSGASCMEDLDESTVEFYTQRAAVPLDLNAAGLGKLRSCGLFSQYQCASIVEYRKRNGDILSFTELALVDGIGERMAGALRLFVVLKTDGAVGERRYSGSRHSIMGRASYKLSAGVNSLCGGLKYSGEFSDFAEVRYSNRTTYDDSQICPGTFGVTYYGRRWLENLVLGDYNLRFGQGLCQWSGTTMTGVSTAAALKKNGSGVSPTGSFSGGRRGAAGTFNLGRGWGMATALSLPGVRERMDGRPAAPIGVSPIAHASYTCAKASFGATAFAEWLPGQLSYGASLDWNAGIPTLNFYGEAAWCGVTLAVPDLTGSSGTSSAKNGTSGSIVSSGDFAFIAGVAWVPRYGSRYGLVLRYYPQDYYGARAGALRSSSKVSDEHAVSAAATLKWLNATLDYVYHPSDGDTQLKALLQGSPEFACGDFLVAPALRYAARLRPAEARACRHDLRADLSLSFQDISLSSRYNVLFYSDFSWLFYLDASYKALCLSEDSATQHIFSVYTRWTLFKVDSWDDRIYCYERDNPGNYTVPAFYGRGWELYAVAAYRIQTSKFRHDIGLRASYKTYPWNPEFKPSVLEFKFQYSVIF